MSMNNKIASFLMFAAGAVVGSIVTWKLVKTKYEQIADEEIKSVKEMYSKKVSASNKHEAVQTDLANKKPSIHEMNDYLKCIKNNGYDEEENDENKENEEGENDMNDGPYVISPDEFGNVYEYTCVSLTYYADGTIADDWDTVIIDPDEEVGPDIESHFGEYEEDTVFVRNDKSKVDYEICRDLRTFAEVIGNDAIDQSDD